MYSFENEFSLERKLANWERIRATLAKKSLALPEGLIDATIHAKNGAAEYVRLYAFDGHPPASACGVGVPRFQRRVVLPFPDARRGCPDARLGCGRLLNGALSHPILRRYMLQQLHSMLTGENMLVQLPDDHVFTDTDYQQTLAAHARPTISSTISANTRPAERITQPNVLAQTKNIQAMVTGHKNQNSTERDYNPARYGRVTLDATGHQQRTTAAIASPGRDGSKMLRSTKFLTQRMPNAGTLSPIKVTTSPAPTKLAPLQTTKRLDDAIAN